MPETTDAQRLTAIALLVVPLTCTPDDNSVLADHIRAIADRSESPEEAISSLGDEWSDALADYQSALERETRRTGSVAGS